ncbi:MAG TPA: glutaredoxin family protein [Gammaproteobacteria bacterium]|nr:glutaredoxin family protein [Gammaproteobacteria bacterium]
MNRFVFILIALTLSPCQIKAEIYKWVDDKGNVHFSDQRPRSPNAEQVKLKINTYQGVTVDNSIKDVGPKIIMYATDWCGYCKKARKYFKKNNITYTEYDIEKDSKAQKRFKKLGGKGLPLILIGDKKMSGFNQESFERLYPL